MTANISGNDRTQSVLLTLEDVAAQLQVSPRTLADWRLDGKAPRAVKLGGAVRWRQQEVDAWIDAQLESA